MNKDTGASACADPALVASNRAAARLDPPGFDPSRFERRVDFIPAFDKRDPNPGKNYGIGSMRIRFVLKGPLGAVQWMIGTSWDVASARTPRPWRNGSAPEGWDLGYHSPKPLYEDHQPMDSCDVLDGPCYYDGSGLNADLLIENFIAQGDSYIWAALGAYYRCTFEDAAWPFDGSGNLASAIEARSEAMRQRRLAQPKARARPAKLETPRLEVTDMDKMMIEKVARAICYSVDSFADPDAATLCQETLLVRGEDAKEWERYIPEARAAITAYNPDDRLSQEVENLKHDLKRQMTIANIECNEVERLREALEECAMALHSFICIIAQRFDGDGTYYWMCAPSHDQAQAAMKATNAASAALSPLPQGDG